MHVGLIFVYFKSYCSSKAGEGLKRMVKKVMMLHTFQIKPWVEGRS